ncbi:MAG: c-type cytochrome biogenesis protein CcsB [Candidatus Cloacimonadota bacterium]|nr:MAG: c-type cytochrome biogenesis protein CcsB [Candidatus Cloacimonadota bacterium]PIE77902.1 MAG: c-type cytochrome biogenesis protein CcsB [Candidatus Delongbacteria bacterium]
MNLGIIEIDVLNPGVSLYLHLIAMYAYLFSGILFILKPILKNRIISTLAVSSLAVGFIPDLLGWFYGWFELGRIPLANMSEFAFVMTCISSGLFLALIYKYKEPSIGTFVVPLIFMTSYTGIYFYTGVHTELVPALQSHWLTWHVLLAAVGSGAFLVSAAVSTAYLFKISVSEENLFSKLLPKASLLDKINYQSVSIGYPLYTIGALFFGSIWAQYAWGTFWGWDPKEIGALIIWIFYSAYLHARLKKGWKERKAAWMSIIGFIMVAVSFFGNNFLGGNHGYG